MIFIPYDKIKKVLLNLLKSLRNDIQEKKIAIALETFNIKDQEALDSYMNGEIEEFAFLNEIKYRKHGVSHGQAILKFLNLQRNIKSKL